MNTLSTERLIALAQCGHAAAKAELARRLAEKNSKAVL